MIKLSVIIVTYRDMDSVRACLESLPQEKWLEVIVVDNTNNNRGFGKACNKGARLAQGEVLLFLNPDCTYDSGDLLDIVKAFSDNPSLGIIGPRLINTDGSHQASYSRQPTRMSAPLVYSFINSLLPQLPIIRDHWMHPPLRSVTEVGVVSGAALFIRSSLYRQLKGFDERMFMYWEEVDLCRRVLQKSFSVAYNPQVSFSHTKATSTQQVQPQALRWFKDSRLIYFQKHFGNVYGVLIEAWLTLTEEWRLVLLSLGVLVGSWFYFWTGLWGVIGSALPLFYWLGVGGVLILLASLKELYADIPRLVWLVFVLLGLIAAFSFPAIWWLLITGGIIWTILDGVRSLRRFRNTWTFGWIIGSVILSSVMVRQVTWERPTLTLTEWGDILATMRVPFEQKPSVACMGCNTADERLIRVWAYKLVPREYANAIVAFPPYTSAHFDNTVMFRRGDLLLAWPLQTQ